MRIFFLLANAVVTTLLVISCLTANTTTSTRYGDLALVAIFSLLAIWGTIVYDPKRR